MHCLALPTFSSNPFRLKSRIDGVEFTNVGKIGPIEHEVQGRFHTVAIVVVLLWTRFGLAIQPSRLLDMLLPNRRYVDGFSKWWRETLTGKLKHVVHWAGPLARRDTTDHLPANHFHHLPPPLNAREANACREERTLWRPRASG